MRHNKLQHSDWDLAGHPTTELLRQYEEGTLPPLANHDIERHLLDCEMCADILLGMTLSDRGRTQHARARIWQRVKTRLRRKHKAPPLHGLADWRVALGVLMMFSSLGLVLFFHYTRTAEQARRAIQAAEISPPSPEELLARTIDAALVLDIPAPPLNPGYQLPSAKSAQLHTTDLNGKVTAHNGQGIAGALIRVQGNTLAVSTDAQGRFSLPIPLGEHTLLVSKKGYASQTYPVESPVDGLLIILEKRK